jgi:hypothetical protein
VATPLGGFGGFYVICGESANLNLFSSSKTIFFSFSRDNVILGLMGPSLGQRKAGALLPGLAPISPAGELSGGNVTITIPSGPPRKSPEIDQKTRLKLVTDALLSLRSKANSRLVELERTDENQLTKLHRGEIICELERIHDRDRHTFRIMRAGHTLRTAAKPASLLTAYSEPVYQWAQWKEIPETQPIILALLDGFDNWCETQTHKQSTTLRTLSENSRLKVFHVVAAIYEQFELTSNPKVSIDWSPTSEAKNHEARQLALNFMEAKGVVTRHKFQYGGPGSIDVEIDIKEFFQFRDELLALYTSEPDGEKAPSPNATLALPSSPFATIDGLAWPDISIRFVDGHNVRVSAKGITETVNFKDMGFEDSRKHNPDTQWALLHILAENHGEISWKNSKAADTIKKRKQVLGETLKAYFHIDDDPFHPYRNEKAYRTKFTIKAEGD